MTITVGIDPGWASCGVSLNIDGTIVFSRNYVPRDLLNSKEVVYGAVEHIHQELILEMRKHLADPRDSAIEKAYIERYVAYKGIHSDVSEKILMFIGAMALRLEFDGTLVNMVRAIDWKPTVCKYLVRTKGFNNPYSSFDKKYSLLAAKTLSGIDSITDHEADAICLSYLDEIERWNKENKK